MRALQVYADLMAVIARGDPQAYGEARLQAGSTDSISDALTNGPAKPEQWARVSDRAPRAASAAPNLAGARGPHVRRREQTTRRALSRTLLALPFFPLPELLPLPPFVELALLAGALW